VRQLLVQRLVDGKRGRGRHQQRVAIALRPCDLLRAKRGPGARLVFDNDGGAKPGLDLLGHQAAEEIGRAAGRIRHDHLDIAAGVGCLRKRRRRDQRSQPAATFGNRLAARQAHGASQKVLFLFWSRTILAVAATPASAANPAHVAAPKAVPASTPESRSAAALALSHEPTFDEGTAERIKQAALSYSDLAVRGGWPTIPTEAKFAIGVQGPN